MSETLFPPEKLVCSKHLVADCDLCFVPTDPMHGDPVDQQLADAHLRIEQLEAELDSATARGRELVDEADARADQAEAALKHEAGGICCVCGRPVGWHSDNGAHYACRKAEKLEVAMRKVVALLRAAPYSTRKSVQDALAVALGVLDG